MPTPEAETNAPEEAEELEPTSTPETSESSEAPTTAAPPDFDWEAELNKLPPEKRWEFLVQMEEQTKALLKLSEEDRRAAVAARKEEREKLEAKLDLLDLSPEERKAKLEKVKGQVEKIEEDIVQIRRETGSYFVTIRAEAERRRRAAEAEELKELMTENSDELIDLFVGALKERNPARCAAILRKLTADTNENELLNYLGYSSDINGMHKFTAEVMIGRELIKKPNGEFELGGKISKIPGTDWKPLGLEPQTAFAIENDISYVAEEKNHWGVARLVEQRFGQFYQVSEEEQAGAVTAETSKLNLQTICRQFNRLAFGGEIPTGVLRPFPRKFQISRSGLGMLLRYGGLMTKFMEKGEFGTNLAAELYKQLDVLRAAGVAPTFCNALEKYVEEKGVETQAGEAVRKAMAAPLPKA